VAQRRAQIVRHRGAEGFQVVVDFLQLARALLHLGVECAVELLEQFEQALGLGLVAHQAGVALQFARIRVVQGGEHGLGPEQAAVGAQLPARGFALAQQGSALDA